MNNVAVFGVFDLPHPGHLFFLETASKYGRLHVIVTPDEIVRILKHKMTIQSEQIRIEQIQRLPYVAGVYLGDLELGSYKILRKISPDIICVGHDQHGLYKHLQEQMTDPAFPQAQIIQMPPFHPEIYSTTHLRNRSSSE